MSGWIPDRDSNGDVVLKTTPFASKDLSGLKLFKRVHGVVVNCSAGANDFDFVVPYNQAKFNEISIVWQPSGCKADFRVYDTPTGTISTVPDYMLNQFGFGVGIAKDYNLQRSEYDADVIKDMKLKCTITCPMGMVSQDICVNFVLNEMKA